MTEENKEVIITDQYAMGAKIAARYDESHSSPRPSIYAALAKSQAEFPPISKDQNVSFKAVKYNYADLGNILRIIQPILARNGLFLSQDVQSGPGGVFITTKVFHESGESIESSALEMKCNVDPKNIGAGITYGRRYSLTAFLSLPIIDEDSDAPAPAYQPRQQQAPQVPESPFKKTLKDAMDASNGLWSEGDVKRYLFRAHKATWPPVGDGQWQDLITQVTSGVDPREVMEQL